ncbi:MAG: type II toxin-antitoxin system prevent-host-death family antitoxin [Patescibacteria group bacterium]
MNTVVPISKVRQDIFRVTDAARDGAYITLTENGEAKAVLMSAEEFDSWRETLSVINEFPDIEKDLARARRAVKTGAHKRYTLMAPYVSRSPRAARGKRTQ